MYSYAEIQNSDYDLAQRIEELAYRVDPDFDFEYQELERLFAERRLTAFE